MLTIEQISEATNITIKRIRRDIAAGVLPSVKRNNRYFIRPEDLSAWQPFFEDNTKDETPVYNNAKSADVVNWVDVSTEMDAVDAWHNPEQTTEFNYIDLFAGAGGLSCGLSMAGFHHTAAVEILEQAVATYNRNFHTYLTPCNIRDTQARAALIEQVKNKHIHLIAGGFPCQGFSLAGHRIVNDERNSLYLEMLKFVKDVMPDFVLMENVEGLRSMLGGRVEQRIIADYKAIGYDINVTLLNSADYGVPQIRKRVIFIGNRIGKINLHPAPIYSPDNYKTVADAISRFADMPENKAINHIFTKHNEEFEKRLAELPEGQSLYDNYSDAWKKVYWEQPSVTVKENHGGVNVHPRFPRVMTPRELAALQSFPDDFIFEGFKKWQLVQIGNAVPPLLGKAVGLAIIKSLQGVEEAEIARQRDTGPAAEQLTLFKQEGEGIRMANNYYTAIKDFQQKVEEHTRQIFACSDNELLLSLGNYNLLAHDNNCLVSSTAFGYIIEEFLVSKLEIYTKNLQDARYIIKRTDGSTTTSSYDCYSMFDGIKALVNIKAEKNSNDAIAAINKLHKDYVVQNAGQVKAYLVLKVHYSVGISKRDGERKIFVDDISSFYLEEIDFSGGHKQDKRSWSAAYNANSGRLQASPHFRQINKAPVQDISYENTREMLKNIFLANKKGNK